MSDDDKGCPMLFPCSCGTSALVVQPLAWDDEPPTGVFNFALWDLRGGHMGLWDRLTLAWYVIRRGHPWYDDVILSAGETQRLARYLIDKAVTP